MNINELSSELKIYDEGPLAGIYLNRPDRLNALSMEMVRMIRAFLAKWLEDEKIRAVFISGMTENVFCAGGDIKAVYSSGMAFRMEQARERVASVFFGEEYALNRFIYDYAKPVITFMNGISMGGAYGIAGPSDFCVVSENTLFSMPESAIGFFPDVGSSYYLNRTNHNIGTYLALSGARINAADLIYTGLATHYIPLRHRDELFDLIVAELNNSGPDSDDHKIVAEVIDKLSGMPENDGYIKSRCKGIEKCFSPDSIEEIILRLRDVSWGNEEMVKLLSRSPTSLKVTIRHLRETVDMTYAEVLERDFVLSQNFMRGHDFYEGVRAVLIDKDNAPMWIPGTLDDVTPEIVESHFCDTGLSLSDLTE
jgi:enoyl-CoA hydratase/carnithine racemase